MFFKMIKSIENNFDNPQVNELLRIHFIELRSVSPEGSSHVLDEHGEFKSIRVADKFRKKRYGEKIITHLIDKSKKIGIKKLSVETGAGEFFAPARKLFKNFGFKKCKPFAHYKEDPNSCYYNLNL